MSPPLSGVVGLGLGEGVGVLGCTGSVGVEGSGVLGCEGELGEVGELGCVGSFSEGFSDVP